jgi:PIN domain nuclease of toxin-antitoxin system
MRVLLDTHVFIWAVTADRKLKPAGRSFITSAEMVFVSAASIWEIAIKSRLGKIDGDANDFAIGIEASGFKELPVSARHAAAVATLPLHHTDPFDRLILAQAYAEPLHLLTADGALAAYGGAVTVI